MKTMILAAALLSSFAGAADPAPKYGPSGRPAASLLKRERTFIKESPAPDFWALIPYYEGMRGGHSASAAAMAAVLNALRQETDYTSADELITEESLLKKIPAKDFADRLKGEKPAGIGLAQFGAVFQSALRAYGLKNTSVKVVTASDSHPETAAAIRKILVENEAGDKNQIVARYIQSAFTGDPEGAVGTYSAVGAFDAARDRVLILETDRKYYEPYWVSLETFVKGLAGLKDKAGKADGGLVVVAKP